MMVEYMQLGSISRPHLLRGTLLSRALSNKGAMHFPSTFFARTALIVRRNGKLSTVPVGYILSAIHVESNKIDFTVSEFFYVIWGSIERDAKFFQGFRPFLAAVDPEALVPESCDWRKSLRNRNTSSGCSVAGSSSTTPPSWTASDDAVVAHLTICSDCECACAHQVVLKLHVRLNVVGDRLGG